MMLSAAHPQGVVCTRIPQIYLLGKRNFFSHLLVKKGKTWFFTQSCSNHNTIPMKLPQLYKLTHGQDGSGGGTDLDAPPRLQSVKSSPPRDSTSTSSYGKRENENKKCKDSKYIYNKKKQAFTLDTFMVAEDTYYRTNNHI